MLTSNKDVFKHLNNSFQYKIYSDIKCTVTISILNHGQLLTYFPESKWLYSESKIDINKTINQMIAYYVE